MNTCGHNLPLSNKDKGRLLLISQAWLKLANKISRLAGQRNATGRLVRETFKENRPRNAVL
jgi:hypothetical protein